MPDRGERGDPGRRGEEIGTKLVRGAGEVDAHGNVQLSGSGALGDGLANLVKSGLTPRRQGAARARRTFGYIQRCWPDPSSVDAKEARAVGRYAAQLAKGDRSAWVIIVRASNAPDSYASACGRAASRRWPGARVMSRLSSSQAAMM